MSKNQMTGSARTSMGFTLLEIIIAVFIFTILSVMMSSGLRTIINVQSGTETSAERLHELQIALVLISRDVEQAVNRPVVNAFGALDPPFVGSATSFTFTHMGVADPIGMSVRSTMQRVRYFSGGSTFQRSVWPVLDAAPQTLPETRVLMANIGELSFQYLAEDGKFYNSWPVVEQSDQPLPRAVRLFLSIPQWGKMSQLYVISAQASNATST